MKEIGASCWVECDWVVILWGGDSGRLDVVYGVVEREEEGEGIL